MKALYCLKVSDIIVARMFLKENGRIFMHLFIIWIPNNALDIRRCRKKWIAMLCHQVKVTCDYANASKMVKNYTHVFFGYILKFGKCKSPEFSLLSFTFQVLRYERYQFGLIFIFLKKSTGKKIPMDTNHLIFYWYKSM